MAREIADPEVDAEDPAEAEERRALQLDRHGKREIERVEDRNLRDHRQAAAGGIDLVLSIEVERLPLKTLRIALVLAPERVDLRLERLHRSHRPHALHRERVEEHLRDDGEQD